MKKGLKKKLAYFLIASFILTVSSFCFGGIIAHAEEHEDGEVITHEHQVGLAQAKKPCCEHEENTALSMALSLHKAKIVAVLYFFVNDFSVRFKNNLASYIHTSSLSPPPEKVALSSVVLRE